VRLFKTIYWLVVLSIGAFWFWWSWMTYERSGSLSDALALAAVGVVFLIPPSMDPTVLIRAWLEKK
jgi:hypothetical protein